jgi:hypothetical protein
MVRDETRGGFNRTEYMREYMKARRAAKKPKPPPAPSERKAQLEALAEEMKALAGEMSGAPRAMMEQLALDYDWLASRVEP